MNCATQGPGGSDLAGFTQRLGKTGSITHPLPSTTGSTSLPLRRCCAHAAIGRYGTCQAEGAAVARMLAMGGDGFVGSHLCHRLLAKGMRSLRLTICPTGLGHLTMALGTRFVDADLRNEGWSSQAAVRSEWVGIGAAPRLVRLDAYLRTAIQRSSLHHNLRVGASWIEATSGSVDHRNSAP